MSLFFGDSVNFYYVITHNIDNEGCSFYIDKVDEVKRSLGFSCA